MAFKKDQLPENRGARGFLKKNFSKDEKGRGVIRNTIRGGFSGIHLWAKDKDGSHATLGLMGTVILGGMIAVPFVDNQMDKTVDWAPDYAAEELQSYGTENLGYTITVEADGRDEAHRYVLMDTDTGLLLMQAQDDNPNDDLLVPVTNYNEASRVAAEIASQLNRLDGQAYDNEDGFAIQYDGLSAVFENVSESGGNVDYIIGDNVTQEIAISADTIEREADRWAEAAQSFIAQDGGVLSAPTAQGEHFDDEYSQFNLWLTMMGGLAGVGAAASATSSIARSRRRFNEEVYGKKKSPKP